MNKKFSERGFADCWKYLNAEHITATSKKKSPSADVGGFSFDGEKFFC
ncbi:MAG: hypothetical protein IKT98_08730 [Selenomonadaceae bacterium]|nr:hypothetical protein [Selenomonadaceae bacterium]